MANNEQNNKQVVAKQVAKQVIISSVAFESVGDWYISADGWCYINGEIVGDKEHGLYKILLKGGETITIPASWVDEFENRLYISPYVVWTVFDGLLKVTKKCPKYGAGCRLAERCNHKAYKRQHRDNKKHGGKKDGKKRVVK